MFSANVKAGHLVKEVIREQMIQQKKFEFKKLIFKIKQGGEFYIFDPNEHGVYDDRYYISHNKLNIYDKVTLKILIHLFEKIEIDSLLRELDHYKTRIIFKDPLYLEGDLIFKDKLEATNFCNYLNSILILNKFKEER